MHSEPLGEATADRRPLIAHVIFRLGVGGLENGVVNLVNRLPVERFRHAIVCLKDFTDFRQRISRPDVAVHAIHKKEGHDLAAQWRLYRLFRQLRPAIVHTRNFGCLEALLPARLAGVPARVHGEHGWDVFDPEGRSRRHQLVRRAHAALVDRYVPLSREIETYLRERIGIPPERLIRIYNGVDTERFRPAGPGDPPASLPVGFAGPDSIVIGTVGRMHGVKDQENLTHAFIRLCDRLPEQAARLRLVMIGDGPLREVCRGLLQAAGRLGQAWLPGAREDVPALMRAMQIFALPSRAEGISNTVLEAMASGVPVVATDVGGNAELVADGETGRLVPRGDADRLAAALAEYVAAPEAMRRHGLAARLRAEQNFSLAGMMRAYSELYLDVLQHKAPQLAIAG